MAPRPPTKRLVFACVLLLGSACGGGAKPPSSAPASTSTAAADEASASAPPTPVDPWPETKPGAAWTVIAWEMNDAEAADALRGAGLEPEPSTDPKSGRVEALKVAGAASGWRASVTFDPQTREVETITVRGDPVTVEAARAERTRLEERFGTPRETRARASKHYGAKAVEIEGPLPSWRITQSLTRAGDAKGAVDWPSLGLEWGMPLAQAKAVMKRAAFKPEKIAKPAQPKGSAGKKKRKKKEATADPGLPPDAPRGAKLIELGFKKGEEHVQLSIVDKTGLFRVGIGQDVPDRKTAERRAREVSSSLGAVLSEAETESTVFGDATADVQLSITGFQGQRIVLETYRRPDADHSEQ